MAIMINVGHAIEVIVQQLQKSGASRDETMNYLTTHLNPAQFDAIITKISAELSSLVTFSLARFAILHHKRKRKREWHSLISQHSD